MEYVTITTCLYDIRKKESNSLNSLTSYLEYSKKMLSIRLPMVIYSDEEDIISHVYKTRLEYGLIEKTIIIRLPFEETFFYKDLDMLIQRMTEFYIVNRNHDKDTPLYVLLNNNKFDFLHRTMTLNPFQTEFFLWMDMGIQHCTNASWEEWEQIWKRWPLFLCQNEKKIHQLRIHTVQKPPDMSWKEYFHVIYHHVAGGVFGGHKDCLLEYIHLFQTQWHQILYEEEWYQLDEAIMTILAETYPEKFRFYYGDYDGILSNFIVSKKSFYLVLQTAQRFLESGQEDLFQTVMTQIDTQSVQNSPYHGTYLFLHQKLKNNNL